MGQFLRDAGAYFVVVLRAYKGMVGGSLLLWFVSSVAFKTPWLAERKGKHLETAKHVFDRLVFLLLLVAPFNVWREQRVELASRASALAAALSRGDSLQAVIPRIKDQLTSQAEKVSAEKKARIVAGLRRLLLAADSLDADVFPPDTDAEARWTAKCRRFLQTCGLDETYLARFDAAARRGDENTTNGRGGSRAFQEHREVLVEFLAKFGGPP